MVWECKAGFTSLTRSGRGAGRLGRWVRGGFACVDWGRQTGATSGGRQTLARRLFGSNSGCICSFLCPSHIYTARHTTAQMQNRQPHLHCTRCRDWDKCTNASCRERRMHPGQFCSHGFQLLHDGPDCPVHCAWACMTNMLTQLQWHKRDAECMSNIVLNQKIGLSQHADKPPLRPLETPAQVLSRALKSAECSKALAAAEAFMAQRSAGLTQATAAAAAPPSPSMPLPPAAAAGHLERQPCRNWAKTGSCAWSDRCRFSHQ